MRVLTNFGIISINIKNFELEVKCMSELYPFKPKARLLLHLGEQLIRNENVALMELVKNSYDADAKAVSVKMHNLENPKSGVITIEDDGDGMDIDIIKNVWMEPGSDYKEKIFKDRKRSKLDRLPLGEKGVGRFGVHKLGNKIEVISRKENANYEVYFSIDWNSFNNSEYLDKVEIEIKERDPQVFTDQEKGTRIIIRDLKNKWNKGAIRDLYRSLNSLNSPFNSVDSFVVDFDIDNKDELLKGLLTFNDIKNYSLFNANLTMDGNYIKEMNYSFTPWKSMNKLTPRAITRKDIKMVVNQKDENNKLIPIDLTEHKIGIVEFEIYIFDLDSHVLSLGIDDKKGLREYLKMNGGIRVFRDFMRVFDYGEPGNDWLDFGARRINAPSERFSNNILIGAVHLKREHSEDLTEKTNREGFIDNDASNTLRNAILFAIEKIETERNIDKEKIRNYYSQNAKTEPVVSNLSHLKNNLIEKIENESVRKEISTYLKRIEDDYNYITDVYIKSAGAGLSLSIVVHEMEKILNELNKVIKKEKPTNRIIKLVNHLANLVEGYSSLLRKNDKAPQDLRKVINQALFNVEFRIEEHKIQIVDEYSNYNDQLKITCVKNLVIASIVNIIDNSIWWHEYAETPDKKIFVGLTNEINESISIIIADNGPGFSLPTNALTKPFVSDKPEGMGMGLYITSEVMKNHGGKLSFPNYGDVTIPEEFKNGAIIALSFKEEK